MEQYDDDELTNKLAELKTTQRLFNEIKNLKNVTELPSFLLQMNNDELKEYIRIHKNYRGGKTKTRSKHRRQSKHRQSKHRQTKRR